jgi:hypothetical protein
MSPAVFSERPALRIVSRRPEKRANLQSVIDGSEVA